jgi:hypothetical protein
MAVVVKMAFAKFPSLLVRIATFAVAAEALAL